MTISEAVAQGIGRLHKPEWAYGHIELYLIREGNHRGKWGEAPEGDGTLLHGPWIRLYDPPGHLAMGYAHDHFQELPSWGIPDDDFEPWIEPADYAKFAAMTPTPQPET